MSKIKLDVIKPWIQDKITEILKIDDDVVVDFVYNQLDEKVMISIHVVQFLSMILFVVSRSEKNSDQFNRIFARKKRQRIYG